MWCGSRLKGFVRLPRGRRLQVLNDILVRCGLDAADERPLHAYEASADEVAALRRLLPKRIDPDLKSRVSAQAFVLWACEHIRTTYPGGQLTWEFVFGGLGMTPPDYGYTQWLVQNGLAAWGRSLRRADSGHREFLYTLVAEGGLPDTALAEGSRYGSVLLRLIADLEAEGALAPVAAALAARRHIACLPQALRHDEQALLLADLALGLVDLRAVILVVAASEVEGVAERHDEAPFDIEGRLQSSRRAVQLRRDADGVRPLHRQPASAVAGPACLTGHDD